MELMAEQKYKQTEVGEMPADWEVRTLGSMGNFTKGQGIRKDESMSGDIPCVRYGELYTRHHDYVKRYYSFISPEIAKTSKRIKPGAILFAGSGETKEEIGKAAAFVDNFEAYAGGDIVVFMPYYADAKFLGYLLNTPFVNRQKASRGQGDAVVHISASALSDVTIPIPSTKEEQIAIATALNDTDALINGLEKLIAKKRKIRLAVMQDLLTGRKRLSGFDEKWQEYELMSLCKVFTKQTGFDYTAHIKPTLVNENVGDVYPFIQNKDFNAKNINFDTDYFIPSNVAEQFPRILLNEKCLLISISGSIGNVGLFSNKKKAFIGGAVAVAKFIDKKNLDWVMYYLLSKAGQEKLFNNVKAGSHQNLILDDIRKVKIVLPPPEEQTAVVAILYDMDAELEAIERKLAKYKEIKQGMMQVLLTGKVRLV